MLHQPRYDEPQVLAERGLLVEETTQVADDMFRYPFQLAFARHSADAATASPPSACRTDLRDHDARRRSATGTGSALLDQRGVIVAVGDLEPETALAELAAVFGGHPGAGARPTLEHAGGMDGEAGDGDPSWSNGRRRSRRSRMAFPGPSRRDPRRYAAEVWSAVASGLGGRLFEALRDRRSLAYTVDGLLVAEGAGRVPSLPISPPRPSGRRRRGARCSRSCTRFAEERVTPDELEQATSYLAGQTEVNRQSGVRSGGGECSRPGWPAKGWPISRDPAGSLSRGHRGGGAGRWPRAVSGEAPCAPRASCGGAAAAGELAVRRSAPTQLSR